MTFDEFIAKYNGQTKGYPDDTQYLGECLSIVKLYIKECFGINPPPSGVNAAYGYWTNFPNPLGTVFEKIADASGIVPSKGDIIIWSSATGGGYGHIAIVLSASLSSQYFESMDQNWGGKTFHKVNHNYNNVLGWLHPKETMLPDEMIIKKSDFENLVTKATKLDEILAKYNVADAQALYSMIGGYIARTTDLGNQLGTAQAEMKNREEQVGRLVVDIANLKSDNESLMDRVNSCVVNYENAVKEKAALAIEVAQLKTQLETAKQGGFTLTIADLFKLIWNQKITITKG